MNRNRLLCLFIALPLFLSLSAPAQAASASVYFKHYVREVNRDEIYAVDIDGRNLRRITNVGIGASMDILFSPDGRRIAFRGTDDQIFVANADGSGTRAVVGQTAIFNPSWSNNSNEFAFVASREGKYQIFTTTADSKIQNQLTRDGSNHTPVWSPNGLYIAFFSDREGTSDLYVMNPDGSNQRRLTQFAERKPESTAFLRMRAMAWSPNSRWIVSNSPENNDISVFLIGVDGKQQVLNSGGLNYPRYTWSRDGRSILVGGYADAQGDIFVISANGGATRNLTKTADKGFYSYSPTISPSGTMVAYASVGNDTGPDIYVINFDGSNPKRLTTEGLNLDPVWPPR